MAEPVRELDRIRLTFDVAPGTPFSLWALNPDGSRQRLLDGTGGEVTAFPPSADAYFALTDGLGTQGFVLATASAADTRIAESDLNWNADAVQNAWSYDGTEFVSHFPEDERPRGEIVTHGNKPLKKLLDQLTTQPHRDVRMIVFPVVQRPD